MSLSDLDAVIDAAPGGMAVDVELAGDPRPLPAIVVSSDCRVVEESLAEARALANEFAVATTLNTVAALREAVGDDRGAAALLGESLEVAWPLRLTWTIGYAVPALAGVAARAGFTWVGLGRKARVA